MTRNARFARTRVAIASAVLLGAVGTLSTTPAMATTFRNAHLAGDQVVPGPGDPDAIGFADVYFAIEPAYSMALDLNAAAVYLLARPCWLLPDIFAMAVSRSAAMKS